MSEATGTTSIAVEKKDAAAIFRPQAKMMDEEQLKALGRLIDEAAADGVTSNVIIDLGRVSILPSLALGLLVQIASKCRARGQKLTLTALQPQIRQVFAITRLDRVFQFADSAEAALQ